MKSIQGYEGRYSVTEEGKVYSHVRKIYLAGSYSHGYHQVLLCDGKTKKLKLVHRLVAQAYIPNGNDKAQVNHLDSDRGNNHVHNLEWSTPLENMRHAVATGGDWRVGKNNYKLKRLKELIEAGVPEAHARYSLGL